MTDAKELHRTGKMDRGTGGELSPVKENVLPCSPCASNVLFQESAPVGAQGRYQPLKEAVSVLAG